jgi:mono/diheme cytochrome c family protein
MGRIIPILALISMLLAMGLPMGGGQSEGAPKDPIEGVASFPGGPQIGQGGPQLKLFEDPGADGPGMQEERGTVLNPQEALPLSMVQRGQDVFHRCIGCHSIGTHDGEAADLLNVPQTRGRAWLARWLASPEQMVKAGDPVAIALAVENRNVLMPTMRLTPDDVEAILTFLEAQNQKRERKR